MHLLIYGFGPYKQFKENITARVLKKLPEKKGVKKVIFPVRFQQRQFIEALKKHKPEVVLGLGQTSRGTRLKIERRAVNRRRENKNEKTRPICPGGARWLSTTLRLTGGSQARQSNNAGDYVCNYSMYVILDYLRHRGIPARFGFIHMPHDYNLRSARRYVLNLVRGLQVFSG